jgi:hypothetical protein
MPKKKKSSKNTRTKRVPYVTLGGKTFTKLSEWKLQNPGKIYFESMLERDCYLILDKSGLDFKFHPAARELLAGFKSKALGKGKDKKIFNSTVRNVSYTMDFLINCPDGTKIFIEAKGWFRPLDRLRYKLFQASLKTKEMALLVLSVEDMKHIIKQIKESYSDKREKRAITQI